MAIRGMMNMMAEGNEYSDESLECETKFGDCFLGPLLTETEMAAFELTV